MTDYLILQLSERLELNTSWDVRADMSVQMSGSFGMKYHQTAWLSIWYG